MLTLQLHQVMNSSSCNVCIQFQIPLQLCPPWCDIYKLFWKSLLGLKDLKDNAPHLVQPTTSAPISRTHTKTGHISSFLSFLFCSKPTVPDPCLQGRGDVTISRTILTSTQQVQRKRLFVPAADLLFVFFSVLLSFFFLASSITARLLRDTGCREKSTEPFNTCPEEILSAAVLPPHTMNGSSPGSSSSRWIVAVRELQPFPSWHRAAFVSSLATQLASWLETLVGARAAVEFQSN